MYAPELTAAEEDRGAERRICDDRGMTTSTARWGMRTNVMRPSDRERGERVAFVELFFDLVFVFALTQISEVVAAVSSPLDGVRAAVLIAALWWLWMNTTWVTNWLDPARMPVRIAVVVLAFAGLVVSTSIQESGGERALAFALGYVGLQVVRSIFMVIATVRHDVGVAADFARIAAWFLVTGAMWIAGALAGGVALVVLWGAAVAVDYVVARTDYALPGLGRGTMEGWDVSAAHVAERASLFIIIALGESFLVTGFAFVEEESNPARIAALASAFLAAAGMWWLYFDHGEQQGEERVERSARSGAMARAAYAYAHVPIVAGIILTGVADKTVIAHPVEMKALAVVTILGGPALFLVGSAVFRRIVGAPGAGILLGSAAVVSLLLPLALVMPAWALSLASTGVLLGTAAIDTALRRRRGEESRG